MWLPMTRTKPHEPSRPPLAARAARRAVSATRHAQPAFALPNKKAHMLRWHAAHPDGEASHPGNSAHDGGDGDGEEDDSATDNGELEVACGSKGAAQHEIGSPETSIEGNRAGCAPTPLKGPGSAALEEM
eukprot:jgi/Tetstr1/444894/TSEL_032732.t1